MYLHTSNQPAILTYACLHPMTAIATCTYKAKTQLVVDLHVRYVHGTCVIQYMRMCMQPGKQFTSATRSSHTAAGVTCTCTNLNHTLSHVHVYAIK